MVLDYRAGGLGDNAMANAVVGMGEVEGFDFGGEVDAEGKGGGRELQTGFVRFLKFFTEKCRWERREARIGERGDLRLGVEAIDGLS